MYRQAVKWYQQAVSLHEHLNHPAEADRALNNLGIAWWALGDYEEAKRLFQASLRICEQKGRAYSLLSLCYAAMYLGEYSESRDRSLESRNLFRELADLRGMAFSNMNLGNTTSRRAAYDEATNYYAERLLSDFGKSTSSEIISTLLEETETEDIQSLIEKSFAYLEAA